MTLFGDIGGLYDFIFLVMTPLMVLCLGDRFLFSLAESVFLDNDSEETGTNWLDKTRPINMTWLDLVSQNFIIRLLSCSFFRPKNRLEKLVALSTRRLEKDLDVRSLLASQHLLDTLLKLLVTSRQKRILMRHQRTNVVVEAEVDDEPLNGEGSFGAKDVDELRKILTGSAAECEVGGEQDQEM